VLDQLKTLLEDLKQFRTSIKAVKTKTVGQQTIRNAAERFGTEWCNNICPRLSANGSFETDTLDKYTTQFSRLIKLSAPANLRSSYLSVLDAVTKTFRTDFILPTQQGKVTFSIAPTLFDSFLAKIAPSDEGEYYKEAIACAKANFFRAGIVMGWCTAIDRIHRKIEEIGFPKFNIASAYMASQTAGRYKKFNQIQKINSLNELREVFDNVILWIIEGMQLIDSNQHTRLKSCFDMRNQAAHPGEAPSTEYNLISFFSDINEIILLNPKFTLEKAIPRKEDQTDH